MFLILGVLAYYGYQHYYAANGKMPTHLFEVAAPSNWTVPSVHSMADGCRWISSKMLGGNRGFDTFGGAGYKKVDENEHDMDGLGNEDTLTDFIDEAEHDDFAPRYDPVEEAKRPEKTTILSGGVHMATDEVPRLQGPPGSLGASLPPAQHFDITTDEMNLL